MSNRFLIGIGLAFVLVFACAIAAVIGITSATDRVIVADDAPSAKPTPTSAVADFAPTFAPVTSTIRLPDGSSKAAPAGAAVVTDSDLASLAAAVKLGASSTGDVSKEVWAKEIPVAQKLLQGLADCDQHNWLIHFVQTGQEAVSGSNHYPESVQLLGKLRRSNHDLTLSQASR